jgi:hypothetical protein
MFYPAGQQFIGVACFCIFSVSLSLSLFGILFSLFFPARSFDCSAFWLGTVGSRSHFLE